MSFKGHSAKIKILMDQGSQITLITESLVRQLALPRTKLSVYIQGIGGFRAGKTKGLVFLQLKSHFPFSKTCFIKAHILPKLTKSFSFCSPSFASQNCLKSLQLADPDFDKPSDIHIIIGADTYGKILLEGLIKGPSNLFIAQSSIFGWIISGSSDPYINSKTGCFTANIDAYLPELLERFWKLEEISTKSRTLLSPDEQACEQHFQNTFSRNSQGRYIVRLPFKHSDTLLGNSLINAERSLNHLTNKFQKDPNYFSLYSKFISEYRNLGHMIESFEIETDKLSGCYLPHHGVLRPDSSTTKLRVVFNGSSQTSSGKSLNDIVQVLLWFRRFPYVFTTDIEKMYRQIQIHPDDRKFQQILWKMPDGSVFTYQLTTVTYGLACAPFLALRVLEQLVKDEGHNFPLALPAFINGRYVDDIFGGADSISQIQSIIRQLVGLCNSGQFPLQKWHSNHSDILKPVHPNLSSSNPVTFSPDSDSSISTLGISWNPDIDQFTFSFQTPKFNRVTKKTILSTIARIFDPLGFLSPIIIKAKIFLQDLWSLKLGWDTQVPPIIEKKWALILDQFKEIRTIKFPRWLGITSCSQFQLHGFCDASQSAYAAVIYLRVISVDKCVTTSFLCSKTKVAPLKRLTIPRLELCGAVLLAKLVSQILKTTQLSPSSIYLWTDSSITHTWINGNPIKWKEFVHNRVCAINEAVPHSIWRLLPGHQNPSDLATRSLSVAQLQKSEIWNDGPIWLREDPLSWPNLNPQISSSSNLECRPQRILLGQMSPTPNYWSLLYNYSSLLKLLRVTAFCQRFISITRHISYFSQGSPLTPADLQKAKEFWVKHVQTKVFDSEIKQIKKGNSLSSSNPLSKLIPFMDSNDLLRVRGRLSLTNLPNSKKYPMIIPKDSPLTTLIIRNAHLRTFHGGTQVTLSFIREEFWLIGGRVPVRSFILNCETCTRYRQQRAQQLMGQLPPCRVIPARPFLNSGVDYAGPITLKNCEGRSPKQYKAYIVVFICMITSAVHLELVKNYSTQKFMAAYRRFTARRGICSTLRSDCGSNFKGADKELKKLFSTTSNFSKTIATLITNDGTKWIFNPPGAPHFGGKWESAVKSMKFHFRRVLGEQILTYEEMNTLLVQIEGILNSRPLAPLTEDPTDLDVLTPGHFLIGTAINTIPEPTLKDVKISHLDRYQLIQQTLQSFWQRWSQNYLHQYQAISKWKRPTDLIKIGSLVLISNENLPPAKWLMARVQELHPGRDGLVRVATLKTSIGQLQRPIAKLCPLPIDATPNNISPALLAKGGR